MQTPKVVLGVILARGGSKSIQKKSITPCAGKPLLYYTVEAARRSGMITRLIISTDDAEMAEVARGLGVEVPFIRPAELAQDDTMDLPVFQHALDWLEREEGYVPDVVVHLRPTTPLKKAADIDRAIEMFLQYDDAESVRSICEPTHTPFKMYRLHSDGKQIEPILSTEYADVYREHAEPYNMPRQKLPQIWRHSGYVDVVRPEVIRNGSMSGSRMYGMAFDAWRDVDIDAPKDLAYAELIIQNLEKQGLQVWE